MGRFYLSLRSVARAAHSSPLSGLCCCGSSTLSTRRCHVIAIQRARANRCWGISLPPGEMSSRRLQCSVLPLSFAPTAASRLWRRPRCLGQPSWLCAPALLLPFSFRASWAGHQRPMWGHCSSAPINHELLRRPLPCVPCQHFRLGYRASDAIIEKLIIAGGRQLTRV